MKYSGTIVGFLSNYGSIYNINLEDSKCYAWKANVDAEITEVMIVISFNWNGESYEMVLSNLKEDYFFGKILFNGELGGKAHLWQFNNNESVILKGDFVEEDAGTFECFIELRPKT